MSDHDDHVQETWNLTRADGDRITIDLWTDGYSVRVDGGPDDGHDDEGGRQVIEQQFLPKYAAAGYRVESSYAVNDPESHDDEQAADEPANKPEACPECGATDFDFAPNHVADFREGDAWLCTGCRWGQWITE